MFKGVNWNFRVKRSEKTLEHSLPKSIRRDGGRLIRVEVFRTIKGARVRFISVHLIRIGGGGGGGYVVRISIHAKLWERLFMLWWHILHILNTRAVFVRSHARAMI